MASMRRAAAGRQLGRAGRALAAAVALGGGSAVAQEVPLADATISGDLPAYAPAFEPGVDALLANPSSRGFARLANFDITAWAGSSIYYDSNVNANSVDVQDDLVVTVGPAISATARDTGPDPDKVFEIQFLPYGTFYLQGTRPDRFNYAGRVNGVLPLRGVTLGVQAGVLDNVVASQDAGAAVPTLQIYGALTSDWRLGYKTSLQSNLRGNYYDNQGFNQSWIVSNDNWINYRFGTRLQGGLGVVIGYNEVSDGVNQTFQQARARVQYQINDRLDASLSAGAEYRQYDSGVPNTLKPVWDLLIAYRPRESTTMALGMNQFYRNSAVYGGQNYLRTGAFFTIRQNFAERFFATLGIDYYRAEYVATEVGAPAGRLDHVIQGRASVGVALNSHWTASIFATYLNDDSNIAYYTYDRYQAGLQVVWRY